jgi:phosphodiesterase/alkaline phosphatase D-like protein
MATDGAEFMSNYGRSVLIPIYEIMNGREADLLIGNGKRIYETQVTKSRNAPLLIEVARRYKRRVGKS